MDRALKTTGWARKKFWAGRGSIDRPTFMLLGAPKCATTSLYYIWASTPRFVCRGRRSPDFLRRSSSGGRSTIGTAIRPTARAVLPQRTPIDSIARNRQCHHLGRQSLPGPTPRFSLRFGLRSLPQLSHIIGVQ